MTVRYIENCISSPVDEETKNSYNIIVKKHNDTFEEIGGHVYLPKTYIPKKVVQNFIIHSAK